MVQILVLALIPGSTGAEFPSGGNPTQAVAVCADADADAAAARANAR